MIPKNVRNDYILRNCVVQDVSKLKCGIYMINFDTKKSMTLKEFKILANEHTSEKPNENSFWNTILERNDCPPVYAIDNEKSLYPNDWAYWGLNRINCEHSIIHNTEKVFKGINTPFLNYGMEYTTFAAHKEDSNLGSINMLHGGMSKLWYAIPSSNSEKLEKLVKLYTPKSIACDFIIRHKNVLIPPTVLEAKNIQFSKVYQEPGDIIVTTYDAYHQGFNLGFNFSESTNYATPNWLHYFDKTRNCNCNP